MIYDKSTQIAQICYMVVHYPDIALIHDLESQHSNPNHSKI